MKRIIVLIILLFSGCGAISDTAEKNSTYIYPPWKHTWGVVRATPFKLRLFIGGKTHFNNPQGLAVVRLDSWEDTTRTGDDDEITAYGVNSGDNCIIYNRSMLSLGIYGLKKDHEKLNQPWGIAADSKGRVYVADRGNSRVVRLFNPGKELQFESFIGGPGDEHGRFLEPRGVALDPQGFVYVTDAALGRVTVFDDDGNVSGVWEDFDGPDGIAVVGHGEKWNFRPQQTFAVVIDSLHQRIRKLSLSGELIAETTTSDWGVEDAFLAYAVIDYHNQLLVTDKKNGCLHKLDADLNYITSFGEPGSGDYQFDEPRGIAIYRRFGQLIVAEREGAQYLWVAVDVPSFAAEVVFSSMWRDLKVAFELTEPAFCEMDIFDGFGRFITRISTRRYFPAGSSSISWNMRIPKRQSDKSLYTELPPEYKPGQILPDGSYTVKARFRATYSSREFYFREVEARFKLGE